MRTNRAPLLSFSCIFRSPSGKKTIEIIEELVLWTLISFISYRPAQT